ncbi:myosin-G heavy chain [Colias croceus]|uniref:myosin-G heavy chain n=1 Tax=Colias crocea TaxID=72248 RepID=UPI001E27FAB2|nr:myosin-G heavy chain [Colias croceus]
MTTMAAPKKTISVYDYPEHLNPFREEDNHNKIRFWTIGRKSRSNSISFTGIKELKNSWSLRSFMKKGKKGEQVQTSTQNLKPNNHVNGDSSPIVFRRAMQYSSMSRSTVGSPERTDRYVYGGSVTPLPRSRFQERLRSSQQDINNSPSATPRMARSDIMGSRLSVASTNPFDEPPVPPVRASRRKKNRAPPPPPSANSSTVTNESVNTSVDSELRITETANKTKERDDDIDELNLKIELRIVEDEDKKIADNATVSEVDNNANEKINTEQLDDTANPAIEGDQGDVNDSITEREKLTNAESEDDILNKVSFSKVNISKYRRNSSVNEDDIRLRRGNLEDFSLSNKRCKSLTNTMDGNYIIYDINLNDSKSIDVNSNEEPQKVICKLYDERKQSIDNSVSSTEKEFLEIDKATRELEREISKLNSALHEDDLSLGDGGRLSVSDIKRKFDRNDMSSPNPIPKPRRSHYGGSSSPINNNSES